jgi:hypothetical protein
MRKTLKRALRFGGLVFGSLVVLLAVAVLLVLFDKPLIRKISQSYISKKAGLPVQIGGLDYTFFPLRVTLSKIKTTYKTPIFTMNFVVNRLEAGGNLRRLINGTKPALDTIDVDIAELRFNQEKISPEPIDLRAIIQQTSGILAYTRQASIRCGRMSIVLPGQNFAFDGLTLALSRAAATNVYDLRLASEKAGAGIKAVSLSLESSLRLDGTVILDRPESANLRLALAATRVTAAGKGEVLKDLTLDIKGAWDISGSNVRVANLTLAVPGLVALSASGSAGLNKPPSLEASGDVRFENLESLGVMLHPSLPAGLSNFRFRGRSRLTFKCTIPPSSSAKSGNLEAAIELTPILLESDKAGTPLELKLSGIIKAAASAAEVKSAPGKPNLLMARLDFNQLAADYDGPGLPLKLKLSGTIKAEGSHDDFRASADMRSTLGAVSRDNLSVRSSSIHMLAEGTKDSANISRFEAALDGVSIALPGDKKLSFEVVNAKGAGRADIDGKSIVVSALDVELPTLSPLLLSGRFDTSPRGIKQAHLETWDLKIPAVRRLLGPFLPPALADWEADGSVDIVLDVTSRFCPTASWGFSGAVDISGTRFNDPSFTVAGDSLSPRILLQGDYELSTGVFSGNATLELAQGESLWKDFYISWDKQPLKTELAGRYDPASGTINGFSAKFVFPALGKVSATGNVRLAPALSFDLHTEAKLGLGPLYSLYSQSGAPLESRLRLAGEVSADLAVAQDKGGTTINGLVTLNSTDIENPAARFSVRGLRAELPVRLKLGEAPPPARGVFVDKGFLRVLEIRTSSFTLKPPAFEILAGTNAFWIEPFSWELFGGRFDFGEIALRLDPATRKFQGAGSLRLPEIDLSRLPAATAKVPLTGRAKFDFPVLNITSAGIATEGQAEIEIFGGQVVVNNLAASNPLTKGREISCNIELRDLDLKRITDIVPFGEITGIIKGEVRGLRISYGQPESFTLRLESVPRKGIAQTFSLKAVDNLTVLSSGQKASGGASSFFMRFIRGFRYARIGIVSTLKNDTFTLNGTIHENGVEYLVKKPALFGINVINRMPDKKISFKEMMSRLERVGKPEASTAKK